jgi:hypothetical protein
MLEMKLQNSKKYGDAPYIKKKFNKAKGSQKTFGEGA